MKSKVAKEAKKKDYLQRLKRYEKALLHKLKSTK
jgi:hypothetical protein